jgi:hypothetical protein
MRATAGRTARRLIIAGGAASARALVIQKRRAGTPAAAMTAGWVASASRCSAAMSSAGRPA